ncbi:hypothetical protein F4823DRAFT_635480 [Ustulina deusta]|nr:hypothetical protein F4823DRAFT_635480 [Ustulina deusta]
MSTPFHSRRGLTRQEIIEYVVAETRACFDTRHPNFRFEKLLGSGAAGVVCRVIESGTPGALRDGGADQPGCSRRLVVKRAIGVEGEEDLRNEIAVLKRLRGAEHIVRIIAGHGDIEQVRPSGFLNRSRDMLDTLWHTARRRPTLGQQKNQGTVYDTLLYSFSGPAVMMEYLENGSLGTLLEKLKATNVLLPNRVLWAFCLCVVRACIAHAYPPDGHEDAPNQLEGILMDRQPTMLGHGDIHAHNIMIGERSADFAEHNLVPSLKLIDFGRTQESEQEFERMVYDLWLEILSLITRRDSAYLPNGQWFGFETRAVEIQHQDHNHCPMGNGAAYPTLDQVLREFLAHCVSADRERRPSLQQMFVETYLNATKPAAAYQPYEALESDAAVEKVLASLLLDAQIVNFSVPYAPRDG